jgi:hypothetical protein
MMAAACSAGSCGFACGATSSTVSGTVYAPNGVDPLPNVLVWVPDSKVGVPPFPSGVSAANNCSIYVPSSALASTFTNAIGQFVLANVPVSTTSVVVQVGRWRRQITIAPVTGCQDNPQADGSLRLPRNKTEGDIPLMAVVTGAGDAPECLLRKLGVSDSEFTDPSNSWNSGRVQFFTGNAGTDSAGAALTLTPSEDRLWGTQAAINQYDMVLFACQGVSADRSPSDQSRIRNFVDAGGRVLATHYSYDWLYNNSPFSATAEWEPDQPFPTDQTGYVGTTFAAGMTLAQWLQRVGASSTFGQVLLHSLRNDVQGVIPPSLEWVTIAHPAATMLYTFDTPVGVNPSMQTGRVAFNDFHAEPVNGNGQIFPAECDSNAMTPEEHLLEYMIFDLSNCVGGQ